MEEYVYEKGYKIDISNKQYHHEIYISNPRKIDPQK